MMPNEEPFDEPLGSGVDFDAFYLDDNRALEESYGHDAPYVPEDLSLSTTLVNRHPTIPEAVLKFLTYFRKQFEASNIYELCLLYENAWNRLSDKYYSKEPWPAAEAISSFVPADSVFLILYKEMTYRHLHARLVPTEVQRVQSFHHYQVLFSVLVNETSVQLPNQWVWNILDEFVYQFQAYHGILAKARSKGEEGLANSDLDESVSGQPPYARLGPIPP